MSEFPANEYPVDATVESWAIRAFSLLIVMSEAGDNLGVERMREVAKTLTEQAPTELIIAGGMHLVAGIAEAKKNGGLA